MATTKKTAVVGNDAATADAADANVDVEMVESAVQALDGATITPAATEATATVPATFDDASATSTPAPAADPVDDLRAFIQNEYDTHVPAMLAYRNAEVWCGRNGVEFRGNGKRLLEAIYDGQVSDTMSEFVPNVHAE